jgi:hypothetical protein
MFTATSPLPNAEITDPKTVVLHFNRTDQEPYILRQAAPHGGVIGYLGHGPAGGIGGVVPAGGGSSTASSSDWLWKLQEFSLLTTASLKSTGQPLANPGHYEMETVGPDLFWEETTTHTANDESTDWYCGGFDCNKGDIYQIWAGAYVKASGAISPFNGRIPDADSHHFDVIGDNSDHDYYINLFGDPTAAATGIRRIGRDEAVNLTIDGFSHHSSNFWNSAGTFFTDLSTLLAGSSLSSALGSSGNTSLYLIIGSWASGELGKLLSNVHSSDDPMGQYSATATLMDLFGTSPTWRTQFGTQTNGQTTYNTWIQLK